MIEEFEVKIIFSYHRIPEIPLALKLESIRILNSEFPIKDFVLDAHPRLYNRRRAKFVNSRYHHLKPANKGGMTTVHFTGNLNGKTTILAGGYSRCRPDENFSYKIGREEAVKSALKALDEDPYLSDYTKIRLREAWVKWQTEQVEIPKSFKTVVHFNNHEFRFEVATENPNARALILGLPGVLAVLPLDFSPIESINKGTYKYTVYISPLFDGELFTWKLLNTLQ